MHKFFSMMAMMAAVMLAATASAEVTSGPQVGDQGTVEGGGARQGGEPGWSPPQHQGPSPPNQGEGPRLIDPPAGRQLHHPPQLLPQQRGRMERHAAAEGMAHQHHRSAGGLLPHLLRQPTGVAGQGGGQTPRAGTATEPRQIGAPEPPARGQGRLQGLPELAGEQPAVHTDQQQVAGLAGGIRWGGGGGRAQGSAASDSSPWRSWAGFRQDLQTA
jgi:hypothetical protein